MRFVTQGQRSPDDTLVVLFRNHTIPNAARTLAEGRPIHDDVEVCEVRRAGSRDVGVYPALSQSHWEEDPQTGEQVLVTYAERFSRQYQQFKAAQAQTKSGTPLTEVRFLTEARRAELRALNIYTVEALAAVDGAELKNLGMGGRDMKNQALAYIEEAKRGVPNATIMAELEALRARNQVLEDDATAKKGSGEGEFADMTLDQLREFITTNSGHAPHGSLGRKTLVRMAGEVNLKANAA